MIRRPKLTPVKVQNTIEIGEREIAILKDLASYRYLTTDQIHALHFPKGSRSYCNKRLRFLYHKPHHLVERHALPLESGKGSSKITYSLSTDGFIFLQKLGFITSAITPNGIYQKVYKMKQNKAEYKRHETVINDVRIAVERAVKSKGWEIEEWITDVDFKHPILRPEMRITLSTNESIPIVPDGFFCIKVNDGRKAVFFLEVDCAEEEQAEFREKIRGYFHFGYFWTQVPTFHKYKEQELAYRVLTVVDGGAKRTYNLMRNCAEEEFRGDKDDIFKGRLFYFTELTSISPETIFTNPIWLIPFKSTTPDERFPLFDPSL